MPGSYAAPSPRRAAAIAAFMRRRKKGDEVRQRKKVSSLRSETGPRDRPSWNGSTLRSGAARAAALEEESFRIEWSEAGKAKRHESALAGYGESGEVEPVDPALIADIAEQLEAPELQMSRNLGTIAAGCYTDEVRGRIAGIRERMERREASALQAAAHIRVVQQQISASPAPLPPAAAVETFDASVASNYMPAQQEGLRRRHEIGDINELVVMAGEGSRNIRMRDEAHKFRSSARATPRQREREERWASSVSLDSTAGGTAAAMRRTAPTSILDPATIDPRTGRHFTFQPEKLTTTPAVSVQDSYASLRNQVNAKLEAEEVYGEYAPDVAEGYGVSEARDSNGPSIQLFGHSAGRALTPRAAKLARSRAVGAGFDFSNISAAVGRAVERAAATQRTLPRDSIGDGYAPADTFAAGGPGGYAARPIAAAGRDAAFATQEKRRAAGRTRRSYRESSAPQGREAEYRQQHLQRAR